MLCVRAPVAAYVVGCLLALIAHSTALSAQEEKAKPQVLFTDVNIFDGKSDKLAESMSVLVEGNLIKTIAKGDIEVDEDATVIDGGGRTLMPGLIDSHVHFNFTGGIFFTFAGAQASKWDQIGAQAAANARDHLMDGYTTVRDTCGMGNGLQKLIDMGNVVGPRIYPSAACISPTSGHGDWRNPGSRTQGAAPSWTAQLGMTQIADSPDEVRAASRRNFADGATQLKLTAGGGISTELDPLWSHAFTQAELEAAVEAAEFFDTYVLVHAYTDRTVRSAIDAGVLVIDHGQMVSEETVKLMVEKGIYWSLNVAGLTPKLLDHPNYAQEPVRSKVMEYFDGSKDLVKLIKKYKPKIVHNVDTVLSTIHQARAHRDFEKHLFAEWFGNHALLVAMTSTPGEMMQLTGRRNPYPGKLGVIEEDAYADIIVVDGNPLEDITVLGANDKWFDAEPREAGHKTIRVIMKDGKIYKNTLN